MTWLMEPADFPSVTFRTSYRNFPLRLRVRLVGLAGAAVLSWLLLWAATGGDATLGPVLTVATPVVVSGMFVLVALFLSGRVFLHTYSLTPQVIEVKQGTLRHRLDVRNLAAISIVWHREEMFAGFLDREGRAILLGRGLERAELERLVDWAKRLSSMAGIDFRPEAGLTEFRRMAVKGLLYGFPF